MSKVVNIIYEGPTERDFIRDQVREYLSQYGIHVVRPIGIETSPGYKGGDIRYGARLKPRIQSLLRGKEDMMVTTLIDFYGLGAGFPCEERLDSLNSNEARVKLLEECMSADIADERFLPHIQLHEFEALVLTSSQGFDETGEFTPREIKAIKGLIDDNPNPEKINNGRTTAPSKRIAALTNGKYEKVIMGNFIILENGGINRLRQKCPQFDNWIQSIIDYAS